MVTEGFKDIITGLTQLFWLSEYNGKRKWCRRDAR
jgi:hypothetical protein